MANQKFIRVSWHRGEMAWGQLGNEVATNAAFGAGAGAVSGGGVFSLPGAAIGAAGGAAMGAAGYGASSLWYNTRSNEDKASWQAGDVQDNMKAISKLLQDSDNLNLKQLGEIVLKIGNDFKNYIDNTIQNKKDINIDNNIFNQSPAGIEGVNLDDINSDMPTSSTVPTNQEIENTVNALFQEGKSNSKFIRIAADNQTLIGNGAGFGADALTKKMISNLIAKYPTATPEQINTMANQIQHLTPNLATNTEELATKIPFWEGATGTALKGGIKGGIAGSATGFAASYGLDLGERLLKGNANVIKERIVDINDAVHEIIKLTQNNPQAVAAGNKIINVTQEVLNELNIPPKQISENNNPQMMTPGIVPFNSLKTLPMNN